MIIGDIETYSSSEVVWILVSCKYQATVLELRDGKWVLIYDHKFYSGTFEEILEQCGELTGDLLSDIIN